MSVPKTAEQIKVDDDVLSAQRCIGEDSVDIGILVLHGYRRNRADSIAEAIAEVGIDALAVSFRGHDGSTGDIHTVSRQDMIEDAIASYDQYRDMSGKRCIGVVGHSIGAYIGLLLTQERPVVALSVRALANYPDAGFDEPQWGHGYLDPAVREFRHKRLHPNANNLAIRAAAQYDGHVHITHPYADDQIPSQTYWNFYRAFRSGPAGNSFRYDYMPGMKHLLADSPEHTPRYIENLQEWLKSLKPVQ